MKSNVQYVVGSFSLQTMTEKDYNAYNTIPNAKNLNFKNYFLENAGYNPASKLGMKQKCKVCGKPGAECIGHPLVMDLGPLEKKFINPFGLKIISTISKVICRVCKKTVTDKSGEVTDVVSLSKLSISKKQCDCTCPFIVEVKEEKAKRKREKYEKRDTDPKSMTGSVTEFYDILKSNSIILPGMKKEHILGLFYDKLVLLPTSMHQMNFNPSSESKIEEITGMIKLYESMHFSINYFGATDDGDLNKKMNLIFVGDAENGFAGTSSYLANMNGKEGLLRNEGINKRAIGTARSVIVLGTRSSCEIQITPYIANSLMYEMKVASHTIRELQKKVGKEVSHLITDSEISVTNQMKMYVKLTPNYQLRIGDMVLKKIENGDPIVFSRHPTFWRFSEIAYDAIIWNNKCIGLHETNTEGHGADFDGDEGNIIVGANLESRLEMEMIKSRINMFGPHRGEPVISITYNGIIGAYEISDDKEIPEKFFEHLVTIIEGRLPEETRTSIDNYVRHIKVDREYYRRKAAEYGLHERSGKILFSMLLPKNLNYERRGKKDTVKIKDGIFYEGRLSKTDVKNQLIIAIHEIDQFRMPYLFVDRGYALLSEYISSKGISISAEDYAMPGKLRRQIEPENMEEKLKKLHKDVILLEDKKSRQTKTLATCTEEQIMRKIGEFESEVMDTIQNSEYGERDISKLSIGSQARGNIGNIMAATSGVFQQYKGNKRLGSDGNRLSPYSKLDSKSIFDKGFIKNSFAKGLTMHETVLMANPSRISAFIVYSVTPECGSASREITANLGGIHTDGSLALVNRNNEVIDPLYGIGCDPTRMRNRDVKGNIVNSSFGFF